MKRGLQKSRLYKKYFENYLIYKNKNIIIIKLWKSWKNITETEIYGKPIPNLKTTNLRFKY